MNTSSKPATLPVKRLDLGLKQTLEAAREVAREDNVPTHTFPRDAAKLSAGTITQDSPAEPVSAQTPPPTASPKPAIAIVPAAERKPKPAQRAPVKRYSVDLPLYAIADIREKAHKANQTKREYILTALAKGGIPIKEIDIREPADE